MTKIERVMSVLRGNPSADTKTVQETFAAANPGETVSGESIRQARRRMEDEAPVPDSESINNDDAQFSPEDLESEDDAVREAAAEYFQAETARRAAEYNAAHPRDLKAEEREAAAEAGEASETVDDEDDEDDETVLAASAAAQEAAGSDPELLKQAADAFGQMVADGTFKMPSQPESPENGEDESKDQGEPADEPVNDEGSETDQHETPAAEEQASKITREPAEGRCNHRMERAGDLCGRPAGHPGVHTTYTQMDKKKAYSTKHAKARYHSDPAYAARVKEASRRSHKKARDERKAEREAAAASAQGESKEESAPAA